MARVPGAAFRRRGTGRRRDARGLRGGQPHRGDVVLLVAELQLPERELVQQQHELVLELVYRLFELVQLLWRRWRLVELIELVELVVPEVASRRGAAEGVVAP
jgi:hypothetical protein